MPRTVFTYKKKEYASSEIDALEYAKRYGEHMIAVKIQNWRAGNATSDSFLGDLSELVRNNQDTLVNSRTE